jgi:hypothetical protein
MGDIQKLKNNNRCLPTELPNNRVDVITDYKFTLSIEENRSGNSVVRKEERGLSTYSNMESKAMVSILIFENFCMKAGIEQLSLNSTTRE